MNTAVVIGLSAVVVAIRDGEAVVLTVRPHDAITDIASPLSGLPFGPFDPEAHRTFELGLRAFVAQQTRFQLGYVEQLYTFADRYRESTMGYCIVSISYLGLTRERATAGQHEPGWQSFYRYFP